jgi:hypothetical protein
VTREEKQAYQKEYHKRYYLQHQEKYKARAREWYAANKQRADAARAAYAKKNPDVIRRSNWKHTIKKKYGLTPEQHATLVASQQGRCGNLYCKRKFQAIDHEHSTGVVRGLLCRACNTALGLLRDDPRRIAGLIRYLKYPPAATALSC